MIYRTAIWVETTEPVSPEHLALRVAEACASYGALRPGEAVIDAVGRRLVVTDTPRPSPFA